MGVVASVSAGEVHNDHIVIDRFIYFRDATGSFHKLQLVEDPLNAGVYILTDVEQSENVPTS